MIYRIKDSGRRAGVRAIALGLVAAIAIPIASARPVRAQVVDQVAASVDGDPITSHDLQTFATTNGATVKAPNDPSNPTTKAALKALITERMLESQVKKYQGDIQDSQVDAYIANLEQQNGISDAQLRAQIAQQGISYDQFRAHARMELEKMDMIDKEVREKVTITPDQIKAYYDAHPNEFKVNTDRFKLAQILIATPAGASSADLAAARAKAEDVRAQAAKGADFAKLAAKYSDDQSRNQGGELGYFSRGDVLDPIQNAIDGMKVGDVSEPVQTPHGFHILKLEARETAGEKPLSEVSEDIQNKLMTVEAQQRFGSWVQTDLVKQHYVESNY